MTDNIFKFKPQKFIVRNDLVVSVEPDYVLLDWDITLDEYSNSIYWKEYMDLFREAHAKQMQEEADRWDRIFKMVEESYKTHPE